MHFFTVLVLGFLAFGSRAVLSSNFQFKLSQVEQCQPVTINISGKSNAGAPPQWLTIVPFNDTPIAIPIPTISRDKSGSFSGAFTTVLPLEEGTQFVASLDDATGENVAKISDILSVSTAPSGDASCLPQLSIQTRRYGLNSTLIQCGIFALTYDTSVISQVPNVRIYSPNGPSELLNLTANDPSTGVATYTMSFSRNEQVVMLFDDNHGHRETSPILTVGGDSSSSTSCLSADNSQDSTPGDDGSENGVSSDSTVPTTSRAIIIGSAVAGGCILSVAVCLIAFIIRERRKRRRMAKDPKFLPVMNEKGFFQVPSARNTPVPPAIPLQPSAARNTPSPQLRGFLLRTSPSPTPSRASPLPPLTSAAYTSPRASPIPPAGDVVHNPAYVTSMASDSIYSPRGSHRTRDSLASWAQPLPQEQRSRRGAQNDMQNGDRMSLNSLDIEDMLNMAASQSSRHSHSTDPVSHENSTSTSIRRQRRPSSPTIPILEPQALPTVVVNTPPSSAGLKRWPSRGHLRPPSDMPHGPVSMTFSSISADPFQDENASINLNLQSPFATPRMTLNMRRSMSFDSAIRFPPEALLGLPKAGEGSGRSPTSPKMFVLRERERGQHASSSSLGSANVNWGVAR